MSGIYHITDKDITQLWRNLKESAKKRGIDFDLTPMDIDDIGIPLTCPILGFRIFFHRDQAHDDSISFDRINSSLGYTRDNLVIVSLRANKLKSDATLHEMESIVNFYKLLEESNDIDTT